MQPLQSVSIGVTKVCVEKINLNWKMPPALANAFDAVVMAKWGKKGKWTGACAAALMYMDASDEDREVYISIAQSLKQTKLPQPVRDIMDAALRRSAADDDPDYHAGQRDEGDVQQNQQDPQHKKVSKKKRRG